MTSSTDSVAVLGLGPMGRALATAFLRAGHTTTVWSRTPGRAGALAAAEAATAAAAIHAARVVVACIVNYEALSITLEANPVNWSDRVLVNLISGDPVQARKMADWAAAREITYLDGAILTPTPTIGTPGATVLYSGPATSYELTRGTLAAIGGSAVHLGEDPGRANAYDVALLDLFATTVHGIAHAFALAAAEDIGAPALAPFATGIGALLPDMITGFARQLDAGAFPGDRSTIASARSAIEHIMATATRHGLDTGALAASRAAIDRVIASGHADDGLARLATAMGSR